MYCEITEMCCVILRRWSDWILKGTRGEVGVGRKRVLIAVVSNARGFVLPPTLTHCLKTLPFLSTGWLP